MLIYISFFGNTAIKKIKKFRKKVNFFQKKYSKNCLTNAEKCPILILAVKNYLLQTFKACFVEKATTYKLG